MTPFTMTAHEVLDALAANPTETCLSELVGDRLDASYFTLHDTLGDLDCYALVVVDVADGILLLPVTEARTGEGWEQFNLAAAYTVPYPEDWNAVRAAYHGAKATVNGQCVFDIRGQNRSTHPAVRDSRSLPSCGNSRRRMYRRPRGAAAGPRSHWPVKGSERAPPTLGTDGCW